MHGAARTTTMVQMENVSQSAFYSCTAFDLLKVGGQNSENLAPAQSQSVKLAIWLNSADQECPITP